MKKITTRRIICISSLVFGRLQYISGQSTRWDGKFLPQFNPDVFFATEFPDIDAAGAYINKIHNPHGRNYSIASIDIPDLPDDAAGLKKYEKLKAAGKLLDGNLQKKSEPVKHLNGGMRPTQRIRGTFFTFLTLISILFSACSTYTCPTINGGKEPNNKSKRFTVSYRKLPNSTYLITERYGFLTRQYITDCKPCQ